MADYNPQVKRDEQYPLLKVDGGGGDSKIQAPVSPTPTGWNVTCTPKQSWLKRCPGWLSIFLCNENT